MKKILMLMLSIMITASSWSQCNTSNSICTPGTAGPFNFVTPGPAVGTCLNWIGPNTGYIVLYITSTGPLNLLINGDAGTGFLDVAIFDVPPGIDPCVASTNPANEIGCNYATAASGCNQFGATFPCASTAPAPIVTAGDVIFIVVENWSGTSTTFTLDLGPLPGAQTGPPDPTINPAGPFCESDPSFNLTTIVGGGTFTGTGVSPTGLFNPVAAGPGTHTITYNVGTAPCNSVSTIDIIVNPDPVIIPIVVDATCFGDCDGSIDVFIPGATYLWTPSGNTGSSETGLCAGNFGVTVTLNGCTSTMTPIIVNQPAPIIIPGLISHN